jgi:hypothetical protein
MEEEIKIAITTPSIASLDWQHQLRRSGENLYIWQKQLSLALRRCRIKRHWCREESERFYSMVSSLPPPQRCRHHLNDVVKELNMKENPKIDLWKETGPHSTHRWGHQKDGGGGPTGEGARGARDGFFRSVVLRKSNLFPSEFWHMIPYASYAMLAQWHPYT